MDILYSVFVGPFVEMRGAPDLLIQVIWEGFVSGILYSLIALGFVLIFKASGVFNFAQGIMVVFSALSLVGIYALLRSTFSLPVPVAATLSVVACIAIMFALAWSVERVVLRPLVNQPDIIMFMATIGLNSFLIGLGESVFGGEPKTMITSELGLPTGSTAIDMFGGVVIFQHLDIAAAVIAAMMVMSLALFFNMSKIGRALRAVADDHQAAMSVGITLQQIWVTVWFAAGIVALVTGIMWGARSDVSFALEIVALKALPVLILGGFTSIPGAIVGGLIIGISEKWAEFYWGPLVGGSIESWFPFFLALVFLLFRPQGLFGEKIIERI
ncbi:MAG: branched-chain amino acid ABC transporter permease [Pseudomonadota bacterium]